MIYSASQESSGEFSAQSGLIDAEPVAERETTLAASVRDAPSGRRAGHAPQDLQADPADGVARELHHVVALRLPGRVLRLAVHIEQDECYVLTGVTNSYYVKQVVQHIAMGLIRRGRLINRIEVRSPR